MTSRSAPPGSTTWTWSTATPSSGSASARRREWNKGYGTDALHAICDFGFGELRLERIELEVYAANARGAALVREGRLHAGGDAAPAHFAEGRHEDVLIMSLLREEWAAQDRRRGWELNELG